MFMLVMPSSATGQAKPAATSLSVLIEDSHGQSRMLDSGNFGQSGPADLLEKMGHRVTSGVALQAQLRAPFLLKDLQPFDIIFSASKYNGVQTRFTPEECQVFADYVSQGGWLVVSAGGSRASDGMDVRLYTPLLAPFGVSFGTTSIPNETLIKLSNSPKNDLAKGNLDQVYGGVITALAFAPTCKPTILGTVNTRPVIAAISHGRGKVIVIGGAIALSNGTLAPAVPAGARPSPPMKDNVKFFTNLLKWRMSHPRNEPVR